MEEPRWGRYRAEVAAADQAALPTPPKRSWAWKTPRFWLVAAAVAIMIVAWLIAWVNTEGTGLWPPLVTIAAGFVACEMAPRYAGAVAIGQVVGLLASMWVAFGPAAARHPEGMEAYSLMAGLTIMAIPVCLLSDLFVWSMARRWK